MQLDEPQLLLRHAEHRRQDPVVHMYHLCRAPNRDPARVPVLLGNYPAGLERHGSMALDGQPLLHNEVGRGERRLNVAVIGQDGRDEIRLGVFV